MMKRVLSFALAAASLIALASACEQPEASIPAADMLAGNYNGTYTLTVMGDTQESSCTYVINKIDDNTITLSTPAAGEGMMALPAITTGPLSVTRSTTDGKEVYLAQSELMKGSVDVNGASKEYSFTELVIAGDGKAVTIQYNLQYGKMPMSMVFAFSGEK